MLRAPNGSASKPFFCSSSEISANTACCAGVSSITIGISSRWLSTFCCALCLQDPFKQHALVRNVLVHDP